MKSKHLVSISLFCLSSIVFANAASFQRRAIEPFNSGNGGNGNNHGKSPIPTKHDQILNPVGSRVIRIRDPVTRPPELPSSHPIRPYDPQHQDQTRLSRGALGRSAGHGNDQEKGKGKVKDEKNSKKRKAEEMANDHEAGTSNSKPAPESSAKKKKKSSNWWKYGGDRYKSKAQRKRDEEALGALIGAVGTGLIKLGEGVYQAGTEAYQKVKETCDAACQRARARINQINNRFRRPEPARRPRSPENSSMVGLLGHRQGELRGWMHSSRKTDVRPATSSAFRNTVQRPNYHHYDSNDSGSSIHGPVPQHQPLPDPSATTSSSSSSSSESASSVLQLVENNQGGSRTRSGRVYNRLDQHH